MKKIFFLFFIILIFSSLAVAKDKAVVSAETCTEKIADYYNSDIGKEDEKNFDYCSLKQCLNNICRNVKLGPDELVSGINNNTDAKKYLEDLHKEINSFSTEVVEFTNEKGVKIKVPFHIQEISRIVNDNCCRYAYPVEGKRTLYGCFTIRTYGGETRGHMGIDIGLPNGTTLYADQDGIAYRRSNNPNGKGWGNYVLIYHFSGDVSLYAHMKSVSIKSGDFVKKGDKIGTSGDTGSKGAYHLHYSFFSDKKTENAKYLPAVKYGESSYQSIKFYKSKYIKYGNYVDPLLSTMKPYFDNFSSISGSTTCRKSSFKKRYFNFPGWDDIAGYFEEYDYLGNLTLNYPGVSLEDSIPAKNLNGAYTKKRTKKRSSRKRAFTLSVEPGKVTLGISKPIRRAEPKVQKPKVDLEKLGAQRILGKPTSPSSSEGKADLSSRKTEEEEAKAKRFKDLQNRKRRR